MQSSAADSINERPHGATRTNDTKTPDLVALFVETNSRMIDEHGIRLPQAIARERDGGLTIMALDACGPGAIRHCLDFLAIQFDTNTAELIFGFDRFTKPGQGTELADLLTVHHWDGHAWRFGVMEYRHEPRLVKAINWENAYWSNALKIETARGLRLHLEEMRIHTSPLSTHGGTI